MCDFLSFSFIFRMPGLIVNSSSLNSTIETVWLAFWTINLKIKKYQICCSSIMLLFLWNMIEMRSFIYYSMMPWFSIRRSFIQSILHDISYKNKVCRFKNMITFIINICVWRTWSLNNCILLFNVHVIFKKKLF